VVTFVFGSRSGSYVALALFGTMFALLGGTAAWEIRHRGGSWRTALVVGGALFLGPVALIHVSSTGGFYEAELGSASVAVRYLLWPGATEVPLGSLERIEALPAFKSRWRLHLVTRDGSEYESATSARSVVETAASRLRAVHP